ncbi:MAG TPA: M20 family metallopeptidase [Planctomycetota bacterium]|jgi:acetylornithine deacetylase/succinyl-diaminopimelate desuccinylase family protein
MTRETILAAAEARRELVTKLLCELIQLDTTNPPGNEKIVAEYVGRFCSERSISFDLFDPGDNRTSLVGRIGSGNSPCLFIPAHSDVVPAGEGWSVPPFSGTVKDGWVWGRGSTDNKGSLAGLLAAADYLKTVEGDFKGTLLLGAIADEEHGSTHGMEWLLKEKKVAADMAFVPDFSSNLQAVEIAEKGLVNVKITFLGKQAHSSTPEQGISALNALAEMIVRTEKWLPAGSRRKHPLLTPTTCVATLSEAGIAHNIVPGKATVVYNLRFLPGQTADGIAQELRGIAEKIAFKRGVRVAVEKTSELAPSEVKPDQPVTQALLKGIEEITGKTPKLMGIGGATLCKQLIWAGIPAIAFGPGDPSMAHMVDERIAIEELVQYTAVVISATMKAVG